MKQNIQTAMRNRAILSVATSIATIAGVWLLTEYPDVHAAICRGH